MSTASPPFRIESGGKPPDDPALALERGSCGEAHWPPCLNRDRPGACLVAGFTGGCGLARTLGLGGAILTMLVFLRLRFLVCLRDALLLAFFHCLTHEFGNFRKRLLIR